MSDREEVLAYAKADFGEVNQAFVDRLIEVVGPVGEARAVDLGTGPADIPARVLRARPGWHIVAVDASAEMLEYARQEADYEDVAEFLELIQADAKNTGLPAHSFDVIFSNSILHHINEVDAFWSEVKRLGKPGAVIFLRDLCRPNHPESARRFIDLYARNETELLRDEYFRSLCSAYTPTEIRQQLKRAGLKVKVERVTDRHLDIYGRLP